MENALLDITHSELDAYTQAQTSVSGYKSVFLCGAVSQLSDFLIVDLSSKCSLVLSLVDKKNSGFFSM